MNQKRKFLFHIFATTFVHRVLIYSISMLRFTKPPPLRIEISIHLCRWQCYDSVSQNCPILY